MPKVYYFDMAEVMLSLSRGDLGTAHNADIAFNSVDGVKVLRDEVYQVNSRGNNISSTVNHSYLAACALVKARGAKIVMLDTKFSGDFPEEMDHAVDAVLGQIPDEKRSHITHVTADYALPKKAVAAFSARVQNVYGMTPVLVFPTSRFTEEDLKRLSGGGNTEAIIKSSANVCSMLGASLMIGAIDAPVAHSAAQDIEIFGLGAVLNERDLERSLHERPSLVCDIKNSVDILAVGSAIFGDTRPKNALSSFIEAAK